MRSEDELLTPSEVANLCRVARSTVSRWAQDGTLTSVRLGTKVVRFRRVDVEAFIAAAAS